MNHLLLLLSPSFSNILLSLLSLKKPSIDPSSLNNYRPITCVLGFKAIGRVFDFIELFNRP